MIGADSCGPHLAVPEARGGGGGREGGWGRGVVEALVQEGWEGVVEEVAAEHWERGAQGARGARGGERPSPPEEMVAVVAELRVDARVREPHEEVGGGRAAHERRAAEEHAQRAERVGRAQVELLAWWQSEDVGTLQLGGGPGRAAEAAASFQVAEAALWE